MIKNKTDSGKAETLRKKTRKRLVGKAANAKQLSDSDNKRLIHELQARQIDPEMQNEGLRSSVTEMMLMALLPAENPNPVLITDITGRVRYANTSATEILSQLGISLDEPLPDLLLHAVRRVIADAVTHEIELTFLSNRIFSFLLVPNIKEGHVNLYGYDITDRKRAEQALCRSEQRFKMLSEVTAQLLQTENPQAIVEDLCTKVMEYLDCHTFFNFLADDAAGRLHLNACAGIPEEEVRKIEWLDYGVAVCGCTAAEGHRIVAEDIFSTADPRTELVKSYGIQAYACHPLLSAGRVIGTLSFGTRSRTTFTPEELELMKTVADQIAIAMERIRLTEIVRFKAREAEEGRQLLHTLMENAPIGITITDSPDGHIRMMSRHGQELLGGPHARMTAEEVSCQWQVYQPDGITSMALEDLPLVRALKKGETVRNKELVQINANGQRLVLSCNAVPLRDASGTITGSIVAWSDITERKQAEQALRESRDDLNRAQAVAHTGSWRLDVQRNELRWSEENHRIFGVPEGTPLTYETFLSIVHPDDRTYVHEKWSAALSGEPYDIEHRIIADGAVKWVRERATLEFDSTGALLGGFGTTQDISEKKQAEIELDEARNAAVKDKNLLEAVMEAIPVGVAITDAQGATIRANRMFEQVWGQPRPETSSINDYTAYKAWWVDTGQPVRLHEWASVRAVHNGETVADQLLEIEQFDGAHRFVINSAAPFLDAEGNIAGSAVAIQDVTARIEAEKALRQSEQLYRAIGESIDFGVWVCEPDGRNIYASDSFLNLVGLTQEQCSDFGWGDVLHPDDAEQTIAAWQKCVRTGGNWDIAHRFRGVDGQWHPVLARGVPVRDEQGRITRWAGINLDISKLKQAQDDLQAAKDVLELRVQERTTELEQVNKSLQLEILERQHVHDIVVRQSRLLESFFSSTITPFMFLDRHFNIIRVNAAYARAFRRSVQEFPGRNYFDIYAQPDLQKIFNSVVATGELFEAIAMPFTFPDRPELDVTYWDWTLTPLLDEKGEVESMVFALKDVTATLQAREALQESAHYTRSLIEASLDPLVTINRDGHIMDANQATELAVGLPREKLIGSDFLNYFTEPENAKKAYNLVFNNQFIRDYPLAIKNQSGKILEVLYNASLYKNSAGEIEGVFAAARDISAQKRIESALRQSEQRLKDAQNIAHLGNWEWNLVTGEQVWSDEMYRIFGYEPHEIPFTHEISFAMIHPDDKEYVSQKVQAALDNETSYSIDFRIVRPDGTIHFVNSQAQIYRDEQGKTARMAGTVLDITERKIAEKELQESEQQLRFLSAELLTAHEVERKRIAGEVHDELGQSMTVLKLRLRTIEKQLRKDQEKLREECLDLLGHADGILKSVRRISRDLTPSILEDLGLSAAVRWLVDNYKKNIDIKIDLQEDNVDSLVPKDLQINIYRILQECLTNIGKHASAENITVLIRQHDDRTVFMVEDDGRGFDAEQILNSGATTKGLGFTTMRERALLLNGTLDIASREGKGTRITLQIPLSKCSDSLG